MTRVAEASASHSTASPAWKVNLVSCLSAAGVSERGALVSAALDEPAPASGAAGWRSPSHLANLTRDAW